MIVSFSKGDLGPSEDKLHWVISGVVFKKVDRLGMDGRSLGRRRTRDECPVRCRPRSTTSSGIHPGSRLDRRPSRHITRPEILPISPLDYLPSCLGILQPCCHPGVFPIEWLKANFLFLSRPMPPVKSD
ncbi:unnamed protein product [Caenorhabditis auriculariae]|uniref:Uncharacterized protein n=1 Tax=Caenorhabditis auriculariae TaxID=2777116 RepID=A0A8S1HVH0_9PELO|nr:unnamed protein product [Caenorhabditis auriculariae]